MLGGGIKQSGGPSAMAVCFLVPWQVRQDGRDLFTVYAGAGDSVVEAFSIRVSISSGP